MSKKFLLLLFLASGLFFVFFQSQSIFGGDAGDLVSAICVGGIPHPPGYPLYTILGRLLLLLPFFTPAWRVSLLSSLPAAGTVTLVFLIIWQLTKSKFASLIGALTLAFNYLFWLYASVPEVFSLNNFFIALLLYLTILIMEKISDKKMFLWFFIAGLSASHHHFSFWFYPVFVLFIYFFNRSYFSKKIFSKVVKYSFFFILGLLPYLYIPIAARSHPIISWDNPVNWENFWHLILRHDYGTFISGELSMRMGLQSRLILVFDGLLLLARYFTWPWMIFIVSGLIFLHRYKQKNFYLIFFLILNELLFLFYSGFPLNETDTLTQGTYIRFLLPGILFGGILLGVGVFWLIKNMLNFTKSRLTQVLIFASLSIIPLSLCVKNFPKINALKNDFTAENMSKDILLTVLPGGILILEGDIPMFNTQYVNFCLGFNPTVKFFPVLSHYEQLSKRYPDLKLANVTDKKQFFLETLSLNAKLFPIFSNSKNFFTQGTQLIPVGLLFRYFPEDTIKPTIEEVLKTNQDYWSRYHDPFEGILKWFQPATLAEILMAYNRSAGETGIYYFNNGKTAEAKEFLSKALRYDPDDIIASIFLAQALSKENNCSLSESELLKLALKKPLLADSYFYLAKNADECFHDKDKKEKFMKIYEEKKFSAEDKLKQLDK